MGENGGVYMYAVEDYRGEPGELTFCRGEEIFVLAQHPNGWWLGRTREGRTGNFPSNFVKGTTSSGPAISRNTKQTLSTSGNFSSGNLGGSAPPISRASKKYSGMETSPIRMDSALGGQKPPPSISRASKPHDLSLGPEAPSVVPSRANKPADLVSLHSSTGSLPVINLGCPSTHATPSNPTPLPSTAGPAIGRSQSPRALPSQTQNPFSTTPTRHQSPRTLPSQKAFSTQQPSGGAPIRPQSSSSAATVTTESSSSSRPFSVQLRHQSPRALPSQKTFSSSANPSSSSIGRHQSPRALPSQKPFSTPAGGSSAPMRSQSPRTIPTTNTFSSLPDTSSSSQRPMSTQVRSQSPRTLPSQNTLPGSSRPTSQGPVFTQKPPGPMLSKNKPPGPISASAMDLSLPNRSPPKAPTAKPRLAPSPAFNRTGSSSGTISVPSRPIPSVPSASSSTPNLQSSPRTLPSPGPSGQTPPFSLSAAAASSTATLSLGDVKAQHKKPLPRPPGSKEADKPTPPMKEKPTPPVKERPVLHKEKAFHSKEKEKALSKEIERTLSKDKEKSLLSKETTNSPGGKGKKQESSKKSDKSSEKTTTTGPKAVGTGAGTKSKTENSTPNSNTTPTQHLDLETILRDPKGELERSKSRWNAALTKLEGDPEKAVAEWDFEKGNTTELNVTKGEEVTVKEMTTAEWWEIERSNGEIGYVPATYLKVLTWKKPNSEKREKRVKPDHSPEDLEKMEKTRWHILQEILSTERQYISSLEQLLLEYEEPLVKMGKKCLIKRDLVTRIFSPVKGILEVSKKLFSLLEPPIQLMVSDKTITSNDVIPPIMNGLVSMQEDFHVYSKYVIDYGEVTELIQSLSTSKPKFAAYLTEASSRCKGLDFPAFFIMPVQRVPRYELLVRELIKNSVEVDEDEKGKGEKGSNGYEVWVSLQRAQGALARIGEMINETKREQEQYEVLLGLQELISPHLPGLATRGRSLLNKGQLQQADFKRSSRKLVDRYAFAFSDMFLVTEMESSLLSSDKYVPVAVWPYKNEQISLEFPSDMATWGLPTEVYNRLGTAFHIKTPFEFSTFFAPSAQEKDEWVSAIEPNIAHVNRAEV